MKETLKARSAAAPNDWHIRREPHPASRFHDGQRVQVADPNHWLCGEVGVIHHRLIVSGRWLVHFKDRDLGAGRFAIGVFKDDELRPIEETP